MIVKKGKSFYRYDVSSKPLPDNWDDAIKNPEYSETTYGPKNQAGFFFFYEDQETAKAVGRIAISRANNTKSVIITSCQLNEDANMLDLTKYDGLMLDVKSDFPITLLNILEVEGIDVLTDAFHRYASDVVPFSLLSADFSIIHQSNSDDFCQFKSRIDAANRINTFFYDCIPFLGQCLSDFGNGFSFKDILENLGYEGYLFLEEPLSPTYCLFGKDKLSKPIHKVFI